jgi:hypothetical protein
MTTFTEVVTEAYYEDVVDQDVAKRERIARDTERIEAALGKLTSVDSNIEFTTDGFIITFINEPDAPILRAVLNRPIMFQVRGVCQKCGDQAWSNDYNSLRKIGKMHVNFKPGWNHSCVDGNDTPLSDETTPSQVLLEALTDYIDSRIQQSE